MKLMADNMEVSQKSSLGTVVIRRYQINNEQLVLLREMLMVQSEAYNLYQMLKMLDDSGRLFAPPETLRHIDRNE